LNYPQTFRAGVLRSNNIPCLNEVLSCVAVPAQPQQPKAPSALWHVFEAKCQKHNSSVAVALPITQPPSRPPLKTQHTTQHMQQNGSRARLDSKQWTEEETTCLRSGMELFSEHKYKWTMIKRHFGEQLKERSNVDLKDRWRNMQGRKQNRKRKASQITHHTHARQIRGHCASLGR